MPSEQKELHDVTGVVKDVTPEWIPNTFDDKKSAWKLKRVVTLESSNRPEFGLTLSCFGREQAVKIGKNATYGFKVVISKGRDKTFYNIDSVFLISGTPAYPDIPPPPVGAPPAASTTNGSTPIPGTDNAARVRGMALHRAVESWVALVCHDKASIARTKLGLNLNGSEKELILALADIAEKEKFPGDKS